jgi:hypothetical protein
VEGLSGPQEIVKAVPPDGSPTGGTITIAADQTNITSSANPSAYGQPMTLTALCRPARQQAVWGILTASGGQSSGPTRPVHMDRVGDPVYRPTR